MCWAQRVPSLQGKSEKPGREPLLQDHLAPLCPMSRVHSTHQDLCREAPGHRRIWASMATGLSLRNRDGCCRNCRLSSQLACERRQAFLGSPIRISSHLFPFLLKCWCFSSHPSSGPSSLVHTQAVNHHSQAKGPKFH